MKTLGKYTIMMLSFLLLASCGGPDLLLINYVNRDGSVTRKIIMTWDKEEFDLSNAQVPVDTSWAINTSMSVSEKGDTIFTLIAEKNFGSVDEINSDYIEFEGANKLLTRWVEFERRFQWFNTIYSYSENVKGAINGYPPEDFFTEEELDLFYMPDEILKSHLEGPDSLRYGITHDSMEVHSDLWLERCLIKAAIVKVAETNMDSDNSELQIEHLLSKEIELSEALMTEDDTEEIMDKIYGEGFYERNSEVIDTALAAIEEDFNVAFEADDYILQTNMPGDLVGTNGYIDTEGIINWKVNGDVILSKDYRMWAESSMTNWWAWIVTIFFLLFVITGIGLRIRRKE